MSTTSGGVRQWMYRYLQRHSGTFDSPAWKVEGDQHIPKLTAAFEQLAEYVATLGDDDPRLISLAEALNGAGWTPERLDEYLYSHMVSTYGLGNCGQAPADFIDGYIPIAVTILRAHASRRRS